MSDLFGPLPLVLVIGMLVFAVLVTLVVAAPSAWVHAAIEWIKRRQQGGAGR